MKPRIFFADLSHTSGGESGQAFPLGIGCVAAYAEQELGDTYQYQLFKFPDRLNEAVKVSYPQIMCFSNFVWNARLSHEFARHIKQHAPDTVVVFGGPNFPLSTDAREDYMRDHPHVDFYIKWEGELSFVELMRALKTVDFDAIQLKQQRPLIDNCVYIVDDEFIEGPDQRVRDLSKLPSPYLSGLFDAFFETDLDVLFETNRGCPYSCTFCNDGHQMRNRISKKSVEMIAEELRYIARRVRPQADMHLADLNYGMYHDDLETSQMIRSIIDEFGWPRRLSACVGKSHPDRCLKAADIINGADEGIFRFGASFQSTDVQVLRNVKRKNVSMKRLAEVRDFNSPDFGNLEYFTEIIVPLPGDTTETHAESLRACVDDLHMNTFEVHQLTLLPGTEMAEAGSRETYEFDVRYRVYTGCVGIYEIGDKTVPCAEIEEIVVGTNSMSIEDYIECRILDFLVKIFIDSDLFEEIFGLIEWMGLSSFGLIRHLKDRNQNDMGGLNELIDNFVESTKEPMFHGLRELEDRVAREDIVIKYVSGELGKNELLTGRSTSYLEYGLALHAMLRDSALSYLETVGRLTPTLREYIKEAAIFSEHRKFDPDCFNEGRIATFSFDFVRAQAKRFRIDPESIRTQPTSILFAHSESGLDLISRTIDKWTDGATVKYGKFFQKENLKIMTRQARLVRETPV
jgi:radical SAM superfamily enzyme YgiQ (UPF0313 family)